MTVWDREYTIPYLLRAAVWDLDNTIPLTARLMKPELGWKPMALALAEHRLI